LGRNHVLNYRLICLSWNCQGIAGLSRSRIPKTPGKLVHFDQETWNALDLLAMDSMRDFQKLAEEAFADLLRKARPAGRPQAGIAAEYRRDREAAAPSIRRQRAGAW
jgi:hypothetical protein